MQLSLSEQQTMQFAAAFASLLSLVGLVAAQAPCSPCGTFTLGTQVATANCAPGVRCAITTTDSIGILEGVLAVGVSLVLTFFADDASYVAIIDLCIISSLEGYPLSKGLLNFSC
ncbi:hypothetical protein BC629DRAFT_1509921 [Irpex lacteus]|nr:hypothetical protein BC629DRAFT_1509921 [Irpex lacteus]